MAETDVLVMRPSSGKNETENGYFQRNQSRDDRYLTLRSS